PGEVVVGKVTDGRLNALQIIEPSGDRVRPPCPHFSTCGGCSLQHASDRFVQDWKAGLVREALAAVGLEAPVTEVVTSPAQSRRRATLAARRTKKGATVGLHRRASATIIEIPDCRLLHPDLMAVITALRELTVAGATRKGEVAFALTRAAAGVDVAATGGKALSGALGAKLASIAARHGLARLSWDGQAVVQAAPPVQMFGGVAVTPPPGAFLQATEHGQAAMQAAVARALAPANSVVDLFAGCGTFCLPLAGAATVHAVEGDADMLDALKAGWRRATGLKQLTSEARDLFRRPLLAAELNRFAAAVIDPPRAGAQAQAHQLAVSTIDTIAHVSCNPVTFARDARLLCDRGFQIEAITIVDQFRWSGHVELVAAMSRS
ncbi:MAG: class I SAM-dependent RNA methyltransferase, partial [Paracoccaceae bacterium]